MASIVIRKLDDKVKEKLRLRAARHGRSMELEVREILRSAVKEKPRRLNLADAIRRHVDPLGGIELQIPRREALPKPVEFKR